MKNLNATGSTLKRIASSLGEVVNATVADWQTGSVFV